MSNIMSGTELLSAALMIGARLLTCGAEIYRVEESVTRVCLAYGAKSADVYAVPTAIIATICMDETGEIITQTCRITQRGTDLNRWMPSIIYVVRFVFAQFHISRFKKKFMKLMHVRYTLSECCIVLAAAVRCFLYCFLAEALPLAYWHL